MFQEDGERIYLASKARLTAAGHSVGLQQLRSYGSCGNASTPMASKFNTTIVKHRVQRGDTLQGIALKYGVTMEDIKRENRLWTTDSLFLREFLDIPVPVSPGDAPRIDSSNSNIGREKSPTSPKRAVSLDNSLRGPDDSGDYRHEEDIKDFLGRIDTSIKKTKNQIGELSPKDDGDDSAKYPSYPGLTLSPALDSVSYQNGAYSTEDFDPSRGGYTRVEFSPKPTVVTTGRRVTTSLQRHRREHEQMFEL